MRVVYLAALFCLVSSGCTYRQAVEQAHSAADAGDWRTALEAWATARDARPKDDEPTKGWEATRLAALADSLDQAQNSLLMAEYEDALAYLDFVVELEPDSPDAYAMRRETREALEARIATAIGGQEARTAYGLAVRLRTLFPTAGAVPGLFDYLRGHFASETQRHIDAKAWDDALAAARTIPEFEPDRQVDNYRLEHSVFFAWADDLVGQANLEKRRGNTGAAAALLARAWEIAGRDEDLAASRQLASAVGTRGAFTLDLQVVGRGTRADRIRDDLRQAVGSLAPSPAKQRATLTVRVDVPPLRCTEQAITRTVPRSWMAGQTTKDNPTYGIVEAQLGEVERDAGDAQRQATALYDQLESSNQRLASFDAKVQQAAAARDQAWSELSNAKDQLAGWERRRVELIQTQGTLTTFEQFQWAETHLAEARDAIAQWQGSVTAAERHYEQTYHALTQRESEREPHARRAQEARASYDAAYATHSQLQQQVSQLSGQLHSIPATTMHDLHQQVDVTVRDWTRICAAPVQLSLRPRWTANQYENWSPTRTIDDSSHAGHSPSGFDPDPKQYAQSDDTLMADADAATVSEVATMVRKMVDDYFESTTDETMLAMQKDPQRATTPLLSLYLGGRGHIDDATLATLATQLRYHYGLEDADLLADSIN